MSHPHGKAGDPKVQWQAAQQKDWAYVQMPTQEETSPHDGGRRSDLAQKEKGGGWTEYKERKQT